MNKFSSIFGQILQIFSKQEFYHAVMETGAERGAKGFSCWQQFVAMMFCQLGQAHSLREICGGLASSVGKLRHLGEEKTMGSAIDIGQKGLTLTSRSSGKLTELIVITK